MMKMLITGGGSGLGAELAKCYGEQGYHIILVGRSLEKLEKVSREIGKKGGSSECMSHDISCPNSVNALSKSLLQKHQGIDCLINNAGVGIFGPIEKVTVDEINKMIDVNVKGTILVTKELIPHVGDKIINIISTAGLRGKVNEAVYCASKFAVRGFTESLQKEFEDSALKIIAVYMGGMDTPFWENSTHIEDKTRLKSPAEVAKEIVIKNDGRQEIVIGK